MATGLGLQIQRNDLIDQGGARRAWSESWSVDLRRHVHVAPLGDRAHLLRQKRNRGAVVSGVFVLSSRPTSIGSAGGGLTMCAEFDWDTVIEVDDRRFRRSAQGQVVCDATAFRGSGVAAPASCLGN